MKFKANVAKRLGFVLVTVVLLAGCSRKDIITDNPQVTLTPVFEQTTVTPIATQTEHTQKEESGKELVFDHSMELEYAKNFSVDYYVGGYKLITISDGKKFLTIPEGEKAPENIEANVILLQMPLQNLLISSTPTMSLINAIGGLDTVTMTTTERDSWYIDAVGQKMDDGKLTFIGSYKEPDYELLLANKPLFSVFSTMLKSVPEVAEKLEELHISCLLDQSTYEEHPLARVEWAKLYGALLDLEEKAEEVYQAQVAMVQEVSATESTGKTAAIFYITSKGVLYARQGGDYVAKMFELAGGEYIFADVNPEETGTMKMEMEEFYAKAKDADYIIYMWNLGGKPETLEQFIGYNEILRDFKAVKEGNVWCTTPDFFQISNTLGNMIKDMDSMLTSTDPDLTKLNHLFKLQ